MCSAKFDNLRPILMFPFYDPADDITAPYIASGVRPKVAILREQGVNGHVEMAMHKAGFSSVDVHMSDIL